MTNKALERPNYLTKPQEIKVWEVQVEIPLEEDRNVYFHYFTCPKKAGEFSKQFNYNCFDIKDFFYSSLEEMRKRRGVKHF